MSLYHELKRRNVIRVAMAYVVTAWLIIQVVETILPAFGYSDVALRYVVIVLAVSFIPVLVLSWAFEITPEGLKKEADVALEHSITRFTGKKLDRIIMVLLAVALGYFVFDKFVLDPAQDVKIAEAAAQKGAEQALEEARQGLGDEKSIAVLPFTDMSPNKDQEYFSDGLSDTLIHVLAQVSDLKVTAKTSSFYFKGKNIDVGEIARQLNVGAILEGSVQKAGERVRVIAQLINAADGTHLWSKSFDRDLKDYFAVQDEIAQEVVMALKVTLLDAEQERLAQRYQPIPEAYEQLILGRYEMARRTAVSLAAAEQHFKQAIELDPDYALAYVDLADTYGHQVAYGGLVLEESLQHRQPLVDRALALDPLSGEAHIAKLSLDYHRQFKTGEQDHDAIEEEYLRAIELNPNYAKAHQRYAFLLSNQGRFEEALAEIRVAAELDPMSPVFQLNVAVATWNVGRAEEALTLIRRNVERTPEFPSNYSIMAQYQTRLGHLGEAQRWFREARRRNLDDSHSWWYECEGFMNLGDLLSAEDCARQLGEAHPEKIYSLLAKATLFQYRGELNETIAIIESLSERFLGEPAYSRWLANQVAQQGDIERAWRLMADAYPELLEDGLQIGHDELQLAAVKLFAALLHTRGETQRRDALLLAVEEQIATMHRIRGKGYGILDVYIHVMRGDRDQAIARLREAIDMGWRVGYWDGVWWLLRKEWILASLHQDPEFIALMDELEDDIRKQRQWYEENKDKPLF